MKVSKSTSRWPLPFWVLSTTMSTWLETSIWSALSSWNSSVIVLSRPIAEIAEADDTIDELRSSCFSMIVSIVVVLSVCYRDNSCCFCYLPAQMMFVVVVVCWRVFHSKVFSRCCNWHKDVVSRCCCCNRFTFVQCQKRFFGPFFSLRMSRRGKWSRRSDRLTNVFLGLSQVGTVTG